MLKTFLSFILLLMACMAPMASQGQVTNNGQYFTTLVNQPVFIGGYYWLHGGPGIPGATTGGVVSQALHGTVVFDSVNYYGFVYTPDNNFVGSDSLELGVCYDPAYCDTFSVYIDVVYYYPALAHDDHWDVESGNTATINLLANDQGTQIAITALSQGSYGTATLGANGTIVYAAPANFIGYDNLSYTITDSAGNTSSANVLINILEPGALTYRQYFSTEENTPVTVYAAFYQDYPIVAPPVNGTVVFDSLSFTYLYTPYNGFLGLDSIDFSDPSSSYIHRTIIDVVPAGSLIYPVEDYVQINFGTGSVAIEPILNDVGTGLFLSSVGQPFYGSVSINGNTVTYTPDSSFQYYGYDYFDYVVCNGGNCATGSIKIGYLYNTQQMNVFVSTPENTPVDIAFNTGTQVFATVNYAPLNGTVSFNNTITNVPYNGINTTVYDIITYTPNAGFTGLDPFLIDAYTASGFTIGRYLVTVDVGGSGNQRMYMVDYNNGDAVDVSNPTGIASPNADISLNLWPVPVTGSLNVSAGGQVLQQVEVLNLVGEQLLVAGQLNVPQATIVFPDVAAGIYLVKVTTAEGTYTRKVCKAE